jgi:hypothetical protein
VTTTVRGGLAAGPLFDVGAGWLPTARQLQEAGLPGGPLAAVTLDVVQVSAAGKWHPVPSGASAAGCARVRRAPADGRVLTRRQAGVLVIAGLGLCRACTAQVRPRGRAGAYLDLARHIIAAQAWTQALEEAAPDADWAACVWWAASTPFAGEKVLDLLDTLGGDPQWQPARHAATTAWQQLRDRADAALARARQAAGPPGLRAHAAAACAVVAAQQDTVMENQLMAAIRGGPDWWKASGLAPGWDAASRAWAQAVCLDADLTAARTALAGAVEDLYGTAKVRDVALLPPAPACSGEDFCSVAEWADAEYRAVRETVTHRWCQRLEAALAEVQAEYAEVTGQWRLLLVVGWPPAAGQDRDLAYLACYPELARTPLASDAPERSPQAIVLHVPGFAARHASAHHSPNLTVTEGPVVPAGSAPSPDQVSALIRYAAAMYAARSLTWPRPGHGAIRT